MYSSFLRAVREAAGLTQRELAQVSGIAQANISAIENGRRTPSADTLNRLVVACGFELAATAGDRTIYCEMPFDLWSRRLPDDPPDERPSIAPDARAEDRAEVVTAVLDAVDAR
ncbi:MAG: helix-turn-helix transcriptional regulator [Acidimicrobiales bacterium]|nr:helix-turn-helix transcriptional regulator [Acidimicrobiales bacterium]